MTYKLDPSIIEKINGAIILVMPDDEKQNVLHFDSSQDLAEAEFDTPYVIDTIEAEDDRIILCVSEREGVAVPFD